jgi:hypothetical protein
MKRQRIHHAIALLAAAPLLFVMGYLLIDQPDCFNPWNDLAHSGAFMFTGMWIICLPALLAAVVCTVNAVFGLLGTLRSRSIEQVAGTETIPKHA